MKSVIQKDKECYLCGNMKDLENHHIFGGPNRKLSERYGLKVYLCPRCHRDNKVGVHGNPQMMKMMHVIGQQAFERKYARSYFMQVFGKNYL